MSSRQRLHCSSQPRRGPAGDAECARLPPFPRPSTARPGAATRYSSSCGSNAAGWNVRSKCSREPWSLLRSRSMDRQSARNPGGNPSLYPDFTEIQGSWLDVPPDRIGPACLAARSVPTMRVFACVAGGGGRPAVPADVPRPASSSFVSTSACWTRRASPSPASSRTTSWSRSTGRRAGSRLPRSTVRPPTRRPPRQPPLLRTSRRTRTPHPAASSSSSWIWRA